MGKRVLYRELIRRIDHSICSGHFFESSWYIYAVLEDRLISLLTNSGGNENSKGNPIRMMGPKLEELEKRSKVDETLRSHFRDSELVKWKNQRNDLMHAMAEGALTIEEVDAAIERLARDGVELARKVSADAMRLKRRRTKLS